MRLLTTTEKRRYANELKSGKTTYKKIAQELSMDEVDVEKQIKRYIRDLEQEQEKQEIQAKNIKVQEEKKLQELTTQKTYIDEVKEKVEDIFESNLELNETKNQLNEIQIVDKETLNSIIDDYKETQEDEYKKTRIGIVQKQLQKENPDEQKKDDVGVGVPDDPSKKLQEEKLKQEEIAKREKEKKLQEEKEKKEQEENAKKEKKLQEEKDKKAKEEKLKQEEKDDVGVGVPDDPFEKEEITEITQEETTIYQQVEEALDKKDDDLLVVQKNIEAIENAKKEDLIKAIDVYEKNQQEDSYQIQRAEIVKARISKNKDLENNNQIDDGVLYFKFEKEKRSYTEIAAMYKVLTVTDVKDRIKKYAKKYGLPVNEEINELDIKVERAKIEKVSEQDEIKNSKLYSLHRDHKMNSTEIASLYDITADEIDKKLTSYALRNNLEYPINFAKEYHEAETEGLTREQIADKFNVSPRTVRDEITKYCEENNLETKETKFKNNILGIMKSNTNENKEISSTGVEKLTNEIATEQPGIIAVAIIDLAGLREHQRD